MKYVKIVYTDAPEVYEMNNASTLIIEEKIDGSQFRINITDAGIFCGSKSVDYSETRLPDKSFELGVRNAEIICKPIFESGWRGTIFAEYLQTNQQNTLHYERVPLWNFIVFDIFDSINNRWYIPDDKFNFCEKWNLEYAPILSMIPPNYLNGDVIKGLLETTSVLGNEKIEGVVVKQYDVFYRGGFQTGMPIFIKFVRPEFKERNKENWNVANHKNYMEEIIDDLANPNRFLKAYNHLRERGEIQNKLQDIAKLVPEVKIDIETEEKERLKEIWWKSNKDLILRSVGRRVPTWYKTKLIEEVKI